MAEPNGKPLGAYIRVSRVAGREGDSYQSPDQQRDAISRWAEYQTPRVELAEEHLDEDESGGTQERPGLEAAIRRALAGETGGIVAMNISRFSRFTEGGLRDLRRLEDAGARLVFTQEQLDTSTAYGRMVYTILLAVHEAALGQIKAGWRVAKARAISEGRQIGPTPLGFQRARVKDGRPQGGLVPDPETAPAVREAFRLAGTEGLSAAAEYLAEKVPTKTFTARKRAVAEQYGVAVGEQVTVPATWNPTTVRRLLRARVYIGEAYYRYRDGSEELNPKAHKALVDERTFALAQVAAEDTQVRRARATFPLTGIAHCGSCDRSMIGSMSGRKGHYVRTYRCADGARKRQLRPGEQACPVRANILAEPLERWTTLAVAKRAAERAAEGAVPVDTEALGVVVEQAEADLTEWAAMPRAEREALGRAAYDAGRAQRTQERDDAVRAYQRGMEDAAPEPQELFGEIMHLAGSSVSVVGMDGHEGELELGPDLAGLRELFERGIRSMTVAKGRGSTPKRLEERVRLELR
ncbi:MAG TPA: recombinase family protein [Thermoleophilaceae bacterium]|nr:recombinase family protein [Thermoleophilaceae bacterium]